MNKKSGTLNDPFKLRKLQLDIDIKLCYHIQTMKTYTIQFWYTTDLRFETTIDANNELEALILARAKIHLAEDWVTAKPFYFKVALE